MDADRVWAKLQLRGGTVVQVVDMPPDLAPLLDALRAADSDRTPTEVHEGRPVVPGAGFVFGFATTQAQVDALADEVAAATTGDALVWVAYPKGSSKRYTCELNRDTGWTAFGRHGFEPVRQVAVDADWSALRMRRVEHIGRLTRQEAISEVGRARLAGGG